MRRAHNCVVEKPGLGDDPTMQLNCLTFCKNCAPVNPRRVGSSLPFAFVAADLRARSAPRAEIGKFAGFERLSTGIFAQPRRDHRPLAFCKEAEAARPRLRPSSVVRSPYASIGVAAPSSGLRKRAAPAAGADQRELVIRWPGGASVRQDISSARTATGAGPIDLSARGTVAPVHAC